MTRNADALREELEQRKKAGLPVYEQQRYANCGRPLCHRCRNGEKPHGPYRYQGWYKNGNLTWVYLGKVPVETSK